MAFLSLPSDLLRILFQSYLRVKDLSGLDIATSLSCSERLRSEHKNISHSNRKNFLKALKNTEIPDQNLFSVYQNADKWGAIRLQTDWICKRGLLRSHLCLFAWNETSKIYFSDPNIRTEYIRELWIDCRECTDCVGDEVLRALSRCCRLRALSLRSGHTLSRKDFLSLCYRVQSLPELVQLNLSDCWVISDEVVSPLTARFSDLRRLELQSNPFLSDASMRAIAFNCPFLEHLDIRYSKLVSDEGVELVVKGCRGLKHINLDFCASLSVLSLETITRHCLQLTTLSMSNRHLIVFNHTDVEKIMKAFGGQLQTLKLSHATHLRRQSLEHLCTRGGTDSLIDLDFAYCAQLSGFQLLSTLTRLISLNVSFCPHFRTQDFLQALFLFPSLCCIHISGCKIFPPREEFASLWNQYIYTRKSSLSVKEIHLECCGVSDEFLMVWAMSHGFVDPLEALFLDENPSVTDRSLLYFMRNKRNLKYLSLRGNSNVSEIAFEALKKRGISFRSSETEKI